MTKQISIVMRPTWGGSSYSQESVEAFYDYSKAVVAMNEYQGRQLKCDVEYYIENVDIGDSV